MSKLNQMRIAGVELPLPTNLTIPLKSKPKKIAGTVTEERDRFIKGPIPLSWISRAASLPGDHTLHVAFAVQYVKGLGKKSIILDKYIFDIFGVMKDSARRAMERLKVAGLLEYKRTGHKYRVTILPVTETPESDQDAP